mgnify:FL=1
MIFRSESATGGSNTGLYFPSTTSVALSTNGVAALTITSGQLVGIGTSSPAYTLDITGSMRATGNVNATNLIGAITSSQVTTALGFTPYNSTNPSSFANSTNSLNINGTASNITGTYSGSITSSQVTTGLGFTPYNSTNPSDRKSTRLNSSH